MKLWSQKAKQCPNLVRHKICKIYSFATFFTDVCLFFMCSLKKNQRKITERNINIEEPLCPKAAKKTGGNRSALRATNQTNGVLQLILLIV